MTRSRSKRKARRKHPQVRPNSTTQRPYRGASSRLQAPPIIVRRWSLRLFETALVIGAIGVAVAHGQVPSPGVTGEAMQAALQQGEATIRPGSVQPEGGESLKLAAGDRIKIAIYGREDVSGEYRISEEGLLRLAALGSFRAASRTSGELETMLRTSIETKMQRESFVSIDVIERQPVFVVGLVAKPGSYSFMPGMAVVHATAAAGGTLQPASLAWIPTEALRETAKIHVLNEEMKRLLVRIARLTAERAGDTRLAVPKLLVDLIGSAAAARLVEDEQSMFDRHLGSFTRQVQGLETTIKEARNEVQAYETDLKNIGEQRKLRTASVARIRDMSQKGLTTSQRVVDTEVLLASAEREAQGSAANLARSRQTLERHERDLAVMSIDRQAQIRKELADAEDQLLRAEASRKGSASIVRHISGMPADLLALEHEPKYRYEILRKGVDGQFTASAATETTLLRPGDVIRASPANAER